MKKVLVVALIAVAVLPSGPRAAAQLTLDPNEWTVDSNNSGAHFAARHMMVSTVRGQLGRVTGKVWYDGTNVSSIRAEIAVDVKGLTSGVVARDNHLRSEDFFAADRFPTMTFKSKRVEPAAAGHCRLIGDLTIRDVTKEVTFDVEGPSPIVTTPQGKRTAATATVTLNRFDYGLKWNQLIEAGAVVGPDVKVTVDLQATRR